MFLPVLTLLLLTLIVHIQMSQNAIAMRTVELPEISTFSGRVASTKGISGSQGLPDGGGDRPPVQDKDSRGEEAYMGELEVAAYCGCDLCVGRSGTFRTYSGALPKPGHTVAADLGSFEIGDLLRIGGQVYTVEDKVSADAQERLCIYFSSHEEAVEFGRQTCSVYKIELPEEQDPSYLGTFIVTGYCSCEKCCGKKEEKLTKTETVPRAGHTIAVDPQVLPLGTKVVIDGKIYTAEDTGSAIKGQKIDIYFDTHEEAVLFGQQEKKVYLAGPPVMEQQPEMITEMP